MTLLLVMLGGAAGAVVRYLVDQVLCHRSTSAPAHSAMPDTGAATTPNHHAPAAETPAPGPFPHGTLAVNVAGSLILGLLAGLGSGVPGPVGALLGTGFCGALTTWSTFAVQTVQLVPRRLAVLNVAATLVLGLGAAVLGRALTL